MQVALTLVLRSAKAALLAERATAQPYQQLGTDLRNFVQRAGTRQDIVGMQRPEN